MKTIPCPGCGSITTVPTKEGEKVPWTCGCPTGLHLAEQGPTRLGQESPK